MRESFGIRIDSDPVARLWSGFGDLPIPADIVEPSPAIYLGAGELISAPDFDQCINGTAGRYDITLSGVSSRMIALAKEDAASVKNAKVHFVRFTFNDDWSLFEVTYDAVFRADKLSVASDNMDGGRERKIILSVGTEDTNRSRSPMAYFTDQDQRKRSPTDAIFSHVSGITQGTMRRFGTS